MQERSFYLILQAGFNPLAQNQHKTRMPLLKYSAALRLLVKECPFVTSQHFLGLNMRSSSKDDCTFLKTKSFVFFLSYLFVSKEHSFD